LLGQEEGGAYRQYHFDARGSTVLLTDATGAVTDRFAYGPYGEAGGRTGYTSTPFQFNGRYGVTTEPNGLLCMRARFYHPILRRFLNQDVLLGVINPGIALNRYAFANGNPVSLMDPFGLCAQEYRSPAWLRALVPGQGAFDNGVTSLQAGRYLDAGLFFAQMLGEQLLAVATLGESSALLQSSEAAIAADTEGQATVNLYRAVSPAEFDDVMRTGAFRAVPGAFEGKQFGLTLEETIQFADAAPDTGAILKATIPQSTFEQLQFSNTIDPFIFKSGVITAQPGAQMTLLNSTVISIEHVF
jgi:RHS repeat-associated protein